MIKYNHKEECCGCGSCAQKCPMNCITMIEDSEGFLYPIINESLCVACNLCVSVCPIQNKCQTIEPISVFAAYNNDERARHASSSGGIFSALAEKTIAEGGIVFGAEFDQKWNVVMSSTDTKEGLARFRGSKYVQAEVGNAFKECEKFLKRDRSVLFTGTPCQIAGLKRFLNKEYNNLLTVDVICHGVPSPKVWQKYLKFEQNKIRKKNTKWRLRGIHSSLFNQKNEPIIKSIKFRDKSNGWKNFRFVIEFTDASNNKNKRPLSSSTKNVNESFKQNTFIKAFLDNLILRPSCHDCAAKSGKSNSDLTIADFWGIHNIFPEIDDDKGISLVMINSKKGFKALEQPLNLYQVDKEKFESVLHYNSYWKNSSIPHPRRLDFFRRLNNTKNVVYLIEKELQQPKNKSWIQKLLFKICKYKNFFSQLSSTINRSDK